MVRSSPTESLTLSPPRPGTGRVISASWSLSAALPTYFESLSYQNILNSPFKNSSVNSRVHTASGAALPSSLPRPPLCVFRGRDESGPVRYRGSSSLRASRCGLRLRFLVLCLAAMFSGGVRLPIASPRRPKCPFVRHRRRRAWPLGRGATRAVVPLSPSRRVPGVAPTAHCCWRWSPCPQCPCQLSPWRRPRGHLPVLPPPFQHD